MAKVLQNFLIGVGLDTEKYDKGAKGVESSLGRMRTLVGFTGAAITGAFTLAGAAAIGAGKRVDALGLSTEKLNTSMRFVYEYGRALAALGGDANDAAVAINSAEDALAQYRVKGQFDAFMDPALAGVDVSKLSQSQTGADFLKQLSEIVPTLNKDQQRIIQQSLSLPDSVMRSLREGRTQLDASIARVRELVGNIEEATQASREFNKELSEFNTRMEGIGNTLAEKVLPGFTDVLQTMGGFLDANRTPIEKTIDVAANNPVATASAATLAVPAAWAAAKAIGWRAIPYAGLGYSAYEGLKDEPVGDWWNQSIDSARDSWRGLTGQNNYSDLPDAPYGSEVPNVGPGGVMRTAPLVDSPSSGFVTPYDPLPQWTPKPNDPYSGFVTPYESIYGGGKVSNAEAAGASPDVIMVQGQRQQAEKPSAPQRVSVQNHLDVKMEIGGRALDSRVIDVIERREQATAQDMESAVDR